MMRLRMIIVGAAALTLAPPALAQNDPTAFASRAETTATIRAMETEMKPDQGFAWKPLLKDGEQVAAIEIWRKPGNPAVHPTEAEYGIVLEGEGELLSGGTMADAAVTNPTLVEGSRIDGGTRRDLKPGDVFLIPATVPHWFGVKGRQLVILGMKLPRVAD
ncbi:cupin domain-containing protein [Sphingomonas sp. CJ99]